MARRAALGQASLFKPSAPVVIAPKFEPPPPIRVHVCTRVRWDEGALVFEQFDGPCARCTANSPAPSGGYAVEAKLNRRPKRKDYDPRERTTMARCARIANTLRGLPEGTAYHDAYWGMQAQSFVPAGGVIRGAEGDYSITRSDSPELVATWHNASSAAYAKAIELGAESADWHTIAFKLQRG